MLEVDLLTFLLHARIWFNHIICPGIDRADIASNDTPRQSINRIQSD